MLRGVLFFSLLVGAVMAGETAWAQVRSGEQVYDCTCIVCHGNGFLGAPKLGDQARWKKLIEEGPDDLVPMALKGIRAMPAKGGNPKLSDIEVARAVIYMANAAGANFAEPNEQQVAAWRKIADRKSVGQKK